MQSAVVPLIPVRMIESWMLADPETLVNCADGNLQFGELGLPANAPDVESVLRPKTELMRAIRTARRHMRRGRRGVSIEDLYPCIGDLISLERLDAVPSYAQFVLNLRQRLHSLGMI